MWIAVATLDESGEIIRSYEMTIKPGEIVELKSGDGVEKIHIEQFNGVCPEQIKTNGKTNIKCTI